MIQLEILAGFISGGVFPPAEQNIFPFVLGTEGNLPGKRIPFLLKNLFSETVSSGGGIGESLGVFIRIPGAGYRSQTGQRACGSGVLHGLGRYRYEAGIGAGLCYTVKICTVSLHLGTLFRVGCIGDAGESERPEGCHGKINGKIVFCRSLQNMSGESFPLRSPPFNGEIAGGVKTGHGNHLGAAETGFGHGTDILLNTVHAEHGGGQPPTHSGTAVSGWVPEFFRKVTDGFIMDQVGPFRISTIIFHKIYLMWIRNKRLVTILL